MPYKPKYSFFIVLISILFSSCGENINTLNLSGSIIGGVSYHPFDNFENTGFSDVLVSLEAAGILDTAAPDSMGEFRFDNVKTGTYNLIFTKPGFGTTKEMGVQMVGGGGLVYCYTTLYKKIDYKIFDFSINYDSTLNQFNLRGRLDTANSFLPENRRISIKVFFNNSADVSYLRYYKFDSFGIKINQDLQFDSWGGYSVSSDYKTYKLYYAVAYCGNYDNGYFDTDSIATVYPSWGEPSNIDTVFINHEETGPPDIIFTEI
ncbi:MAG: carboxypeptidase-like regulatory domain-containing protein [Bacteroidales bacterium]|nr:carboxypeptidase-like regulatory domain-containing protein [Bacteroidales bacterium]MCF8457444.1 carboxypeptidase-like regulatory domain-containing protein [Bacteroidales bacterium]